MGSGRGGLSCCGKALLILINQLVMLIGLVFLGAGVALKVMGDTLAEILDQLLNVIPDISGGAGIKDSVSNSDIPLDLSTLLSPLSSALIAVGVVLSVLGFLGCCGACCSSKCMLYTYAALILTVFLVKFILLICFITDTFADKIKGAMKTMIRKQYIGIDGDNVQSVLWSFIMIKLECCGVDDFNDFNDTEKWNNIRDIDIGNGFTSTNLTMTTPVACCKMTGSFPDVTPLYPNCTVHPSDVNSNWKTGCYDKLKSALSNLDSYTVPVIVVLLLAELACGIIAIYLAKTSGSSSVYPSG